MHAQDRPGRYNNPSLIAANEFGRHLHRYRIRIILALLLHESTTDVYREIVLSIKTATPHALPEKRPVAQSRSFHVSIFSQSSITRYRVRKQADSEVSMMKLNAASFY